MLLTRELFAADVGGREWRLEYYAYLERELRRFLRTHEDRLRVFDRDTISGYVTAAEYGLALEHATCALSEHEIAATERELRRLGWLAELMGSERARREIALIPVIGG